jgi:hypothetical protein
MNKSVGHKKLKDRFKEFSVSEQIHNKGLLFRYILLLNLGRYVQEPFIYA